MQALDLIAFSKRLPRKHRALAQLIRDTFDLHTSHTDLRLAYDLARRAVEMQANQFSVPADVAEDCGLALLNASIVAYARGTKARSRHRKTFDLRGEFNESEKQRHQLICALRDDAVAHYGPGHFSEGARLRDDHMLLPVDAQSLIYTSRSTTGSTRLLPILVMQSQRAMILAQKLFEAKEGQLVQTLNQCADDPDISEAHEACWLNMGEALGDPAVADDVLRGPRVGSRRISGRTAENRS